MRLPAGSEVRSVLVDSHAHVAEHWYEPAESLLAVMARCGIDRSVLVQSVLDPSPDYVLAAAQKYPDSFVAVTRVDPASIDLDRDVSRLVQLGSKGLRVDLRTLSATTTAPPFHWSTIVASGLPVSCIGPTNEAESEALERVLTDFPDFVIVTEHLAGRNLPASRAERLGQMRRLRRLAKHPNAHAKLHGLGELIPYPFHPSDLRDQARMVPDVLAVALDAFGPRRLMWGSDYPLVSSREGYRNALEWMRSAIELSGADEPSEIFAKDAMRLFFTEVATSP
jgi:L-fuconolactonase